MVEYKGVYRGLSGAGHDAGAERLRGRVDKSARSMTESSRRISRYRKQSTR